MKVTDTMLASVATITARRMVEIQTNGLEGAWLYEPLVVMVLLQLSVILLVWRRAPTGYKRKVCTFVNAIDRA